MEVLGSTILDCSSGLENDICTYQDFNYTKKTWFYQVFLCFIVLSLTQHPNTYNMKKTDLEQLVKDLIEMNKYLIKENEELKKDLKKGREVFLETIDRWDKSVERLTKK